MLTFTVGSGPALDAAEFADFDTGQAVYAITGIGAFTLGWDPDHRPEADQDPMEEILHVAYGTGPHGFTMDEAPVLTASARRHRVLRPHRPSSCSPTRHTCRSGCGAWCCTSR